MGGGVLAAVGGELKTQAERGHRDHFSLPAEAQRGAEICPRTHASHQQQLLGLTEGNAICVTHLPFYSTRLLEQSWMNGGNRPCVLGARALGTLGEVCLVTPRSCPESHEH